MDKPEALRLADALMETHPYPLDIKNAAAELRRLHPYETAYKEWHEKTEWVQTTARPGEFGMHRADVMRQRLEQAKAQRDALLEALKAAEPYLSHADVDYNVYVQCRASIALVEGRVKAVEEGK